MYELVHIFETFLPQLLLYPNPSDPLNGEAAALLNRDPAAYAKRVKVCLCIYDFSLVPDLSLRSPPLDMLSSGIYPAYPHFMYL